MSCTICGCTVGVHFTVATVVRCDKCIHAEQRAAEAVAIVEALAAKCPTRSTGYMGGLVCVECLVCDGVMSMSHEINHRDDCVYMRARKWAGK